MTTQVIERTEPILSFKFGEKITKEELKRYATDIEDALKTSDKIKLLMVLVYY